MTSKRLISAPSKQIETERIPPDMSKEDKLFEMKMRVYESKLVTHKEIQETQRKIAKAADAIESYYTKRQQFESNTEHSQMRRQKRKRKCESDSDPQTVPNGGQEMRFFITQNIQHTFCHMKCARHFQTKVFEILIKKC